MGPGGALDLAAFPSAVVEMDLYLGAVDILVVAYLLLEIQMVVEKWKETELNPLSLSLLLLLAHHHSRIDLAAYQKMFFAQVGKQLFVLVVVLL